MTVASSSAATSTSPLPRHTPVISPLQSRPPFALAPRQQQGGKRSAGSWLRRRAAFLLPRTKVRLVVAWSILLVGTFAALFSFQILTFDLPPLDDYDVAYPPGGIQDRSFEEPDFSLLSTPQPHTIGCPQRSSPTAPLLLLGVFSSPEKIDRRTLIRREVKPDWPADLVEFRFIFGRPKGDNDEDRRKWERVLAAEQEEHGDVVIVDTVENIDSGKTHAYFEWVAEKRQGEKPQFVMWVPHSRQTRTLVRATMGPAARDARGVLFVLAHSKPGTERDSRRSPTHGASQRAPPWPLLPPPGHRGRG